MTKMQGQGIVAQPQAAPDPPHLIGDQLIHLFPIESFHLHAVKPDPRAGTADKAFFIRQRKEFQLVSGPRPILMGDAEILHGCIQFIFIKRIHAAGMHHRTAAQ